MKRILLLTILLLALAAIAFFYLRSDQGSTIEPYERDFGVKDTGAITKIFIADKGDRSVLLERQSKDEWTVNGGPMARPENINSLLVTLKRMRANYPVPRAAMNTVIRDLAAKSKKIELYTYDPDQPVKTFYMGSTVVNGNGNYMLMDGADQPYAVDIPGFDGYLTTRFGLDPEEWRSRAVFLYPPDKIEQIQIEYPEVPDASFSFQFKDGTYSIFKSANPSIEDKGMQVEASKGLNYTQAFRKLYSSGFANDFSRKDSVYQSKPAALIKVREKNGEENLLRLHYMPINKRSKSQFKPNGEKLNYDVDYYFAFMNESQDMMLIQDYVFGKVLLSYDDFIESAKPKRRGSVLQHRTMTN